MAWRERCKLIWYYGLQVLCRLLAVTLFRLRCEGREHVPSSGGVMLLSTHQSHLDPILLGVACNRRLNSLARKTLFHITPLRWLINSLDAIPIDRDGVGLEGIKETLRRLKGDKLVLIFPEGTRTPDGEVQSLKSGFTTLARRAHVPMVPVAIEGAFDAWPRWKNFPWPAAVQLQFGPAIGPDEAAEYGERELVLEVERRLRECHAAARRARLLRLGRRSAAVAPRLGSLAEADAQLPKPLARQALT